LLRSNEEVMVKLLNSIVPFALALTFAGGISRPAHAQNISNDDIQRLQINLDDAARDVSELRGRDSALASRLETELDDLRDETIYFKVKIKKNEPVARTEYFEMRDRIDTLRSRARGTTARSGSATSVAPTSGRTSSSRMDVPTGTELDV